MKNVDKMAKSWPFCLHGVPASCGISTPCKYEKYEFKCSSDGDKDVAKWASNFPVPFSMA